jgi:N-acyl-D-aspartate/D-glutamate deacylase
MEGVEDIPGAALAEGIRWNWESFPQFMDALDATPHSLDFLCRCRTTRAHGGDGRARLHPAAAGDDDIAAMRALVREALEAGAAASAPAAATTTAPRRQGDAGGRGDAAELCGIAGAFDGLGHGVVQMVSDFDC